MITSVRPRSDRYPDSDDDNYTDTTYFDKNEKYLDIGYQRLKIINIKLYPELSTTKSLFINNNNLTVLPDPKYMPHLTTLDCANNKLKRIPFYPNLTMLVINNNKIEDIKQYEQSQIKYLDCSFNNNINLDIYLPNCRKLYITDCNIELIDLKLFPILKILDCENNKIKKLSPCNTLVELGIQNNLLTAISKYPNLVRLFADNNKICSIDYTFEKLLSMAVSDNYITYIKSQPVLEKLSAKYNCISILSPMPKADTIDVTCNQITKYTINNFIEHAYLYFNPITDLEINFDTIKELKIGFFCYKHICNRYSKKFELCDINTSIEKLEQMLTKMENIFNQKMRDLIKRKISKIKFIEKDIHLLNLTALLYCKLFNLTELESITQLSKTKEFIRLFGIVEDMYYNTMIITLYFNGYKG